MFQESNERLSQATMEARQYSVTQSALDRGEDAIMRAIPAQSRTKRPLMWLSYGFGAAAAFTVVMMMASPATASAADIIKIANNGDRVFRHMQSFNVQPDGTFKLSQEIYADADSSRYTDSVGDHHYFRNGRITTVRHDGAVIIESSTHGDGFNWSISAKDIIEKNTQGGDSSISVKRGMMWQGAKVDRYVVERNGLDGEGHKLHLKMELYADPMTQRAIEVDAQFNNYPRSVTKWEYPTPDPSVFEVPKTDPAHIYDIDVQRAVIRKALGSSGTKQDSVELLQLWIDDFGHGCAIVAAGYKVPYSIGVRVNGHAKSNPSVGTEIDTRYAAQWSAKFEGRDIQMFETGKDQVDMKSIGSTVKLEIPIVKDGRLTGYRTFDDVPVHRTYSLLSLVRPENVPFWMPVPKDQKSSPVIEARPVGK